MGHCWAHWSLWYIEHWRPGGSRAQRLTYFEMQWWLVFHLVSKLSWLCVSYDGLILLLWASECVPRLDVGPSSLQVSAFHMALACNTACAMWRLRRSRSTCTVAWIMAGRWCMGLTLCSCWLRSFRSEARVVRLIWNYSSHWHLWQVAVSSPAFIIIAW